MWDKAHHHLQWAVCRHKSYADARQSNTPTYQPGQLVWLSTQPSPSDESPVPLIIDEEPIYAMKEILDSRCRGDHLEYLEDWEGYVPEERSWVPCDGILDPALLTEVHQQHPHRPVPHHGPESAGADHGRVVLSWVCQALSPPPPSDPSHRSTNNDHLSPIIPIIRTP